jgi:hypothetical protein
LRSESGVRRLGIVGAASDRVRAEYGGQVIIGHRGYPFTFIEIQVDEQGNGKGTMIPFTKLVFNKQGMMNVESMGVVTGSAGKANLVNVHSVK